MYFDKYFYDALMWVLDNYLLLYVCDMRKAKCQIVCKFNKISQDRLCKFSCHKLLFVYLFDEESCSRISAQRPNE